LSVSRALASAFAEATADQSSFRLRPARRDFAGRAGRQGRKALFMFIITVMMIVIAVILLVPVITILFLFLRA